ncbi:acetylserotonin O-methyltransferase [Myxococcus sp. RHSTA-1-4]|uniref:acetylserotonin O-methyltransferase n=1 Tax=Myxococcus sp. RHSTA-1-4 TaxID=2874601 RepID=UPI001CBBFA95|nr:acetylserotonin O-methyltransferase [Myxococcus sp. RHSTA-1-4]MBZ4417201.1 SAM-dependent methyltransferase [Myxococcus sp. RHSTA-1-4]
MPVPELELLKVVAAQWASQSIYAAVKLGVIDTLERAGGTCDGAELARRSEVREEPLNRVLRALVKLKLLEEPHPARFRLTGLGRCLRTGAPGALASWALLWGGEFQRSWCNLLPALRTGETAFDQVHGMGLFEYLQTRPERARLFDSAMTGLAGFLYAQVPQAYDFSGYGTIVDVGGGHGHLLASILRQAPKARGVLFDQPQVVGSAGDVLRQAGVAGRCEKVGGDFFSAVPGGGDLYVLSNILHDWDNTRAEHILRNCRRAMVPSGRLLLVEMMLSSEHEPDLARMTDLNMLTLTGGKERTEAEFVALLARAGFRLSSVRPLQPMTCLIEAVPT